ncbi:MAG: coproporphyrinogen III oxidase [Sulfuricurvum sp.]|uniref:coproporphyrinogen III oxidase n=1 Tax=Sulfuricurvum sp. TaxID=2025608 RepID=UPI0025D1D705|nr:coproporphyrinogen III oxidase [Sulfuricurvum sp.]MCK9372922.1 coproporphyrinogen III oxidase [Sulfuricurvum sp.]
MKRIAARSLHALKAAEMIEGLQAFFVRNLDDISETLGNRQKFQPVEWFRDEGSHGGGIRYIATDTTLFNRASVNYSQVHYDDDTMKKLSSATAVSTIIHPLNPLVPSMHMHISWTEMRDGKGYWRIMADLNPSNFDVSDKERFTKALREAAAEHYEQGSAEGDRYFFIPALGRHRGVSHFYLENYNSGDNDGDMKFARSFGEAVIRIYIDIIREAIASRSVISERDRQQQLEYHTLYLLQVLTLDRGTTSGLLIHNQNDIGILGSIPSHVDKELLQSWVGKLHTVQNHLLQSIIEVLPEGKAVLVDDTVKRALAKKVRDHYRSHPEALALQASSSHIPPTVNNHR